jgi:lipoate-protein ligase A
LSEPRPALYTESPSDAGLDVAVSHALLRDAAERGIESWRVWTPPRAVSFGRLDLMLPGAGQAIAAARELGLEPVRRLAGGRAAAIGPGTACLGWACPSPEMSGMQQRYKTFAEMIIRALAQLGIDGCIGELEGEWCPGAWSVLLAETKVGGLAQRVIKGGAWTEAVIVVSGSEELGPALDRVQHALGVPWQPATLGQLSDARAGLTAERTREALIEVVESRPPVRREASLPPPLRRRAASLRERHEINPEPSRRPPRPSGR